MLVRVLVSASEPAAGREPRGLVAQSLKRYLPCSVVRRVRRKDYPYATR